VRAGGRSLQSGRTSAPIIPHLVQTAFGHRSRTAFHPASDRRRSSRCGSSRDLPSSRLGAAGRRARGGRRASPSARCIGPFVVGLADRRGDRGASDNSGYNLGRCQRPPGTDCEGPELPLQCPAPF
jgi:hypothetical protein